MASERNVVTMRTSITGLLRLGAARPVRDPAPEPDGDAPALLFLPAFNEEEAVGACLARVPDEGCGRRVRWLVVDDGSTDRTAERARAAGVDVISLARNTGLGGAARVGLAAAVTCGAAAVAFCDSDGEYRPEELER